MTILLYIKTIIILMVVDLIWLSTGGKYAIRMTEKIQKESLEFRYASGFLVYLALAYLLLQTKSYKQAFLYGLTTYMVYDFTNYALLKDYDLKFAIADSLWGGILFVIVYHIVHNFIIDSKKIDSSIIHPASI
jgi:uncharacterized membrane protein